MALTRQERALKAERIIHAMREQYEADGEEGDFEDGERYLNDDATDDELLCEEEKWCKQM
jgi:hypothetical protein